MSHCFDHAAVQARLNGLRARTGSALTVPCYVAKKLGQTLSGEKRIGCPAEPEIGLSPHWLHNLETQTPHVLIL